MSNIQYQYNPKHRSGIAKIDRTIWVVSIEKEEHFFWSAVKKEYLCIKNNFWWIETTYIGKTDSKKAFIAKFKSDNNDLWHGYPVTAERCPQDVPPTNILETWLKLKLLKRKDVKNIKIGRGYADTI